MYDMSLVTISQLFRVHANNCCLLQASQGEAGTEATLALGLLLKQGNDVGSFLLATDAAEGLAKATLEMETTVLFDTHRYIAADNCMSIRSCSCALVYVLQCDRVPDDQLSEE